ncbi:hypothetical protein ACHWQZ_G009436 [Mnemiopsis leidyi]
MSLFSRLFLLLALLFILQENATDTVKTKHEKDDKGMTTIHADANEERIRGKRESGGDDLKFQIWSSRNTESKVGVLMAKEEEGSWAPVCRKKNSRSDYLPTTESGRFICNRMNYRMVNNVGNVWMSYSFAEDYADQSKVNNLECTSPTQCTYGKSSGCDYYYYSSYKNYYRYYYTTISCSGCKPNTYISRIHCLPCPVGATSSQDSTICNCTTNWYMSSDHQRCLECPANSTSSSGSSQCDCPAGQFFLSLNSHDARCSNCPPNTYSAQGALKCINCPSGAISLAGSERCECQGGLYMKDGVCKECSAGFYSYSGATECSRCPGSRTSSESQSFCSCPPGSYWGVEERDCVRCGEDHYTDSSNNTECTPCPAHSTSVPGSSTCRCNAGYRLVNTTSPDTTSLSCEGCPENYFSTAGSLNCTRCPHFTTAKPASGECYRCTLGEYWENHTCNQCPEHLYGDGVQCSVCPERFQVDQGFCHKKLTEKTAVAAFVTLFLFVCATVSAVVGYRVREWCRRRSRTAGSVKMSELTQPGEKEGEVKLGGEGEVGESREGSGGETRSCEVTCCDQMETGELVTREEEEEREEENVYESLREMKSADV